MEKLLIYRERFLKFLTARGRYIQSGMRFLGGTVLFYVLGELFGYTETFSQPFFIFMMGVISVFIPISALSLIFYVVIFLELLHVSLEVTLFFALVVVLYFLVYQRVFPETRIYPDDGANLLLFSTTCMFTDLCWDVLWNCRTSSDLNGNSDLLSVQYPSADNEPAGIRISTWEGLQSDRGKSDRQ